MKDFIYQESFLFLFVNKILCNLFIILKIDLGVYIVIDSFPKRKFFRILIDFFIFILILSSLFDIAI